MNKTPTRTVEVASDELYQILKRTNKEKPAKEDVQALRRVLREDPELWRKAGDLMQRVQEDMINGSGKVSVVRESLLHGVKAMRRELGYDEAPPLERLLIDQVVLTWLHYYRSEYGYQATIREGTTVGRSLYWERLLNAAQRRYLRSIETLSRVRKLSGRRAIQINIAEQQVNVSG